MKLLPIVGLLVSEAEGGTAFTAWMDGWMDGWIRSYKPDPVQSSTAHGFVHTYCVIVI